MYKDYGIHPNRKENVSPKVSRAMADIKRHHAGQPVIISFDPGTYNFHPKGSEQRELYISNHDQVNPKNVGIAIEQWHDVTIEAPGAEFVFHGTMLPIAVIGSANCTLSGFSIDFANPPHITQVEILDNEADGIIFNAPSGAEALRGKSAGIAFNKLTHHLIYRTSDLWCPIDSLIPLAERNTFRAPKWRDKRLTPGTIVALRSWGRPAPGIFLSEDSATMISNVKVHYAEGMGLLAQLCNGVTLEGFGVCLRGDDDPRYFTTQADATHFSGCKGLIKSVGGLYEGMMDDAINVHGTYLKVTGQPDSRTLSARYMHSQSYGFKWGEPGDTIQIILAQTMEALPQKFVIDAISEATPGVKDFTIRFTEELPQISGDCGIENLTWSPEVYFADNTIRNNRARGSLFSTPRRTIVERNLFDHTSGTAILLCGDCMGWYETGACRDVTIRHNRFINALTNQFQFTEAVISIYPEIHNLADQREYFHSGIRIENNEFHTFDSPLLYAKSTDGVIFQGNKVVCNSDFAPYHPNHYNFRFERCRNVEISGNQLPQEPSIKFD
ncbi:MAG: alpha-1,3-galactosidase B [Bacteroides sp.]|nr:alpha-1,3-galactosidase B [Bacteroides sp.]MCM1378563.1 alpha-1,3-galactosidase B [Bacteroides sp.]MCM1444864.1 alpha-1,3-galactosidase B [Prevotella sp.]